MANEYLQRTPTSTGNRRVWTWGGWIKRARTSLAADQMPLYAGDASTFTGIIWGGTDGDKLVSINYIGGALNGSRGSSDILRDPGSWYHILVSYDSTLGAAEERIRLYVNGKRILKFSEQSDIGFNINTTINSIVEHNIGRRVSNGSNFLQGEMFDVFLVDGQALTPDVFGFYKQGKGYISVGSTQSTDFRPGQWVPKTPRVIKTEINRRGGFGVNGFYLPMNDSRNFGADFHGEPNSIITLNEKLPQPRVGVATTASVGLGYTDALRADPYAANLVLALPFVSGGLSSGFGDYAPSIKGSGTAKSITVTGTVSIASTASYYGSAALFNATSVTENNLLTVNNAVCDFGTGDFTVEFWGYPFVVDTGNNNYVIETLGLGGTRFAVLRQGEGAQSGQYTLVMDNNAYDITSTNYGINQWHHLAVCRKNGLVTAYLNGVATYTNTITTDITAQSGAYIGAVPNSSVIYEYQGYLQDLRIYKGVAKYTGGFDVPRPYTPVGIATWRAVPDTTANNFNTWNPLSAFDGTQTNGNLTSTTNDLMGTVGVSTGKWYWEIYDTTAVGVGGNVMHHGVSFGNYNRGIGGGFSNASEGYLNIRLDGTNQSTSGTSITITSQTGTVPTYSNGDIYAIALDLDNGQVRHYRNGSVILTTNFTYNKNTQAIPYTRNNGLSCSANFGQNPTFSGNTTAGTFTDSNGKGLFKYQPPSGFLALCEDNLPTPAISDPGKHFKTVLYTGDSNSGRSIVGVGFTPDLVWLKARSNAYSHKLYDSVRGFPLQLDSNSTGAEVSGYLNSTNIDGFSLGSDAGVNGSGSTYVAWCWRAGAGTTSTNTNGSITSVVSVNQDAGFSIVSYTGSSTNSTVGHGLGKPPAFVITKSRSEVQSWRVYHKSLGKNKYITLDLTDAAGTLSDYWGTSEPSSTILGLYSGGSAGNNRVGQLMIAYCWAEIEGFSKAFSYVGNGSADGPFTFLNFKPALIIIKRTDNVGNWQIYDSSRMSTNPNNGVLFPNLSNVEGVGSAYDIDFLSNGFKLRSTDTDRNASGSTYVGFAWAESPFTTSNSK